jgi:lipopolysaccharide transport system ATP-binding protein
MSDIAIKVNGLSKRYRIGLKEEVHDTLVGAVISFIKSPLKNFKQLRRLSSFEDGQDEEDVIWALRDVSFEVKKGEVVGVIGRNGAGKSTLLKILSGITFPTTGRAEINGRVASLLEVGTGFHPELTGRENVYLNGTILGMTRKEIDRKFDEIVDFSGVKKFIDTPVKRYSSGMRVRLAFSVAAHLEAEILLIDEVLAVGDVEFQKKCLGKMDEVARRGRTVLFVSHNMDAIRSLTESCIYLSVGEKMEHARTDQIVEQYLGDIINQRTYSGGNLDYFRRQSSPEYRTCFFTNIFVNESLGELSKVEMGSKLKVVFEIHVEQEIHGANLTMILKNFQGQRVVIFFSWDQEFSLFLSKGSHQISLLVDDLHLAPGLYFADIGINQSTAGTAYDAIIDLPLFEVLNSGKVLQWISRPWGAVHWDKVIWENETSPSPENSSEKI